MRLGSRKGTSLIEGVIFIPLVILLLLGMMEFGRVAYTYYQLQKVMYAFARQAGTQQNINLCDPANEQHFYIYSRQILFLDQVVWYDFHQWPQ